MQFLDAYTLRARVFPVVVVILPPLLLLGAGVIRAPNPRPRLGW